ncbi:hypothetical protein [Dactylosporangium sp. CA-139066]|uniref:hypothetical protein n=1 Tax=Dactylosporangium sp. CA-139066 TaxID=3239930 RepID=UPI003D92BCB3
MGGGRLGADRRAGRGPGAAAALAATGVRQLLLMVEGGGEPRRTLANLERLGREVLPPLRRLH